MDKLVKTDQTFYTASGGLSGLSGMLPDLLVGIGGLNIPVYAHVTEALSYDILIGMDWLVMAGARIDLDGNSIVLRKGLDLDITAPLLSSRRMTYLYEPGTVHSLMYAGSFIIREESPHSFPISIYDSEDEDDPDLIFYTSSSSTPSDLSHQDVVPWTLEAKPYTRVCGRYIPCSSSAPCHAPVFCPECYGGVLEMIFTAAIPSS